MDAVELKVRPIRSSENLAAFQGEIHYSEYIWAEEAHIWLLSGLDSSKEDLLILVIYYLCGGSAKDNQKTSKLLILDFDLPNTNN